MKLFITKLAIILIVFCDLRSFACSTAYAPNSKPKFMGKNFVWYYGEGRVVINRANMEKIALTRPFQEDKAMKWKSKYPSITFNQIANDFPMGGINTEGLGVEILLSSVNFPQDSSKKILSELQWIQYILDTSKNVEEAIANSSKVDVVPHSDFAVHYHVCDKQSSCAVFEYVEGQLKVFSNESEAGLIPLGVNNSLYYDMEKYSSRAPSVNLSSKNSNVLNSFDRCEETRKKVIQLENDLTGNYEKDLSSMFQLMDKLNFSPQWQIVYALAEGKLAFKTQLGGMEKIYNLGFEDFLEEDLDCRKATISREIEGKNRYFVKNRLAYDIAYPGRALDLRREDFLSSKISKSIVNKSIKFLDASSVPRLMSEKLFKYPATHTRCR